VAHIFVAALARSAHQKGSGVIDNVAAQERLAVLKLFIDSNDRIALRWLLGYGSNNFRENAYARLRAHCEQNGAEPWDALAQLATGQLRIPYTQPLVERYRAIRTELDALRGHATLHEFIPAWLQDQIDGSDPFHGLVSDLCLTVERPDELLVAVIEAVSQPDVPPDVTEVRVMSLHKSKGLSAPVVIIAGCIEGLLPTADDLNLAAAENTASLEEQRRLLFVGLTRVKADPANNRPGVLILTSSRSMSLADAMQSGIRPARVVYGRAHVHASRFIQELGPSAPATQPG